MNHEKPRAAKTDAAGKWELAQTATICERAKGAQSLRSKALQHAVQYSNIPRFRANSTPTPFYPSDIQLAFRHSGFYRGIA